MGGKKKESDGEGRVKRKAERFPSIDKKKTTEMRKGNTQGK